MRYIPAVAAFLFLAAASPAQDKPLTYDAARVAARSTGKPIVIFVGVKPRAVEGFVSSSAAAWEGYPAKCVVVGDRNLDWVVTLPENASDADVRKAAAPKASPFAPSSSADGKFQSAVAEMMHHANNARVARGMPPLAWSPELCNAAQSHANVMATANRLRHSAMGYGEIIAWNQASPAEAVGDWLNSPGHRRTMMGAYTSMGGGVATGRGGQPYWILIFD